MSPARAATEARGLRLRIRDARALWAIGRRIDARLMRELLLTTIVSSFTFSLRALWLKLIVDAVANRDLPWAMVWSSVFAANGALRAASTLRVRIAAQDVKDKALLHFESEAMELASRAPGIAHLERSDFADRIAEYRQSVPTLVGSVGTLIDGVTIVARVALLIGLLLSIAPQLVLLPLFALPSVLAAPRSNRMVTHAERRLFEPARLSDHLFGLLTESRRVPETRIFRLEDEARLRLDRVWRERIRLQTRAQVRAHTLVVGAWLPFAFAFMAALAFTVGAVARGSATIGDLVLIVVMGSQVNFQLMEVSEVTRVFHRVFEAADMRRWLESIGGRDGSGDGVAPPERLVDGIRLENVSFRYPAAGTAALEDVSLHIPAGATIAIVGENGAGKTTLVKLLIGMYQPDRGSIHIDGVPLSTIDPVQWRSRLTAAFQDFVRFETTLQHSIGIGDLPSADDAGRVLEASRVGGATDVIESLPHGLSTQLGLQFDGGTDVSGGQWQAIAVSRSAMRALPLVAFLDEPSASLDAEREFALFQQFGAMARRQADSNGGITVLVSHRFSTVRMADLIVVIEHGRIAQLGSHEELMACGGLYAELFSMQASAYAGTPAAADRLANGR